MVRSSIYTNYHFFFFFRGRYEMHWAYTVCFVRCLHLSSSYTQQYKCVKLYTNWSWRHSVTPKKYHKFQNYELINMSLWFGVWLFQMGTIKCYRDSNNKKIFTKTSSETDIKCSLFNREAKRARERKKRNPDSNMRQFKWTPRLFVTAVLCIR